MEDKEYYSNEINLISTGEGPFQWIVGLYQYHEQVNQNQGIRAPLQPELQNPRAAAPIGGERLQPAGRSPSILTATCRSPVRCSKRTRYAVFSQVDYQLSETWKTTVGVRYTEDEKDADEYRTRVVFLGQPGAAVRVLLART